MTTQHVTLAVPTLTITRVRFLEDDVWEGDFPRDDVSTDVFEWDQATDTPDEIIAGMVQRLQWEGLTFSATGNEYAANPDGTTIIDYGLGRREETTAAMTGITETIRAAIMERVG